MWLLWGRQELVRVLIGGGSGSRGGGLGKAFIRIVLGISSRGRLADLSFNLLGILGAKLECVAIDAIVCGLVVDTRPL